MQVKLLINSLENKIVKTLQKNGKVVENTCQTLQEVHIFKQTDKEILSV